MKYDNSELRMMLESVLESMPILADAPSGFWTEDMSREYKAIDSNGVVWITRYKTTTDAYDNDTKHVFKRKALEQPDTPAKIRAKYKKHNDFDEKNQLFG